MNSSNDPSPKLIELQDPLKINEYLKEIMEEVTLLLPEDVGQNVCALLGAAFDVVKSHEAELALAAGYSGMGVNILQESKSRLRSNIRSLGRAWSHLLQATEQGKLRPAPIQLQKDVLTEWLESHPEDRVKYAGMHVAVHHADGIVAAGTSVEEMYRALQEMKKESSRESDEFCCDYIIGKDEAW